MSPRPHRPDRRAWLLGAGAALALPAVAGAATGVGPGELRIGQSITLQGGHNLYGVQVLAGIRVLLERVNGAGGVGGRRLLLRTLDDHNQPSQAEANARQLVTEGAFILFGSIEGGPSSAVMRAAIDAGVPFFGPMAGSPGLRRPQQPLVFPVRAEHREEFRALIDYGRRTGLRRVGLFHSDSEVGRQHLDNVRALAEAAGMAFGGGAPFPSDVSDAQLDALAQGFRAGAVDLVLNHGSAPIYERLVRRARSAGLRTSYWGVNSGSTPLAQALGPLAHGMVFAQIVPSPWARKTALARDYQADWQRSLPDQPLSYGSLEGYMTARALVAALQAAGPSPTRAGLLRALADFDTDLGGVRVSYRRGDHVGSSFVDLAMVGRDGRFIQ